MTTIGILEAVKAWTEQHVCPCFWLYRAADITEAETDGYTPECVHPAVYTVRMPPNAAEWSKDRQDVPIVAPAIIIGGDGATEIDTQNGWTETAISVTVQVWNPGIYTTIKDDDGKPVKAFIETSDGWMSVSNVLNRFARELMSADFPAGMRLVGNITFDTPAVEDSDIWPFYRGELRFTLQHSTNQNKFKNLL